MILGHSLSSGDRTGNVAVATISSLTRSKLLRELLMNAPLRGSSSLARTNQNKNPTQGGALVLVIARGIEPRLPG